jgi:hypothetical protein
MLRYTRMLYTSCLGAVNEIKSDKSTIPLNKYIIYFVLEFSYLQQTLLLQFCHKFFFTFLLQFFFFHFLFDGFSMRLIYESKSCWMPSAWKMKNVYCLSCEMRRRMKQLFDAFDINHNFTFLFLFFSKKKKAIRKKINCERLFSITCD